MSEQHTPEPAAYMVTHYQDKAPNVTLTTDRKRAEWLHGYYGKECSGVKRGSIVPLFTADQLAAQVAELEEEVLAHSTTADNFADQIEKLGALNAEMVEAIGSALEMLEFANDPKEAIRILDNAKAKEVQQ